MSIISSLVTSIQSIRNRITSLIERMESDFSVTAKSKPSLSSFTPPVSTSVTG